MSICKKIKGLFGLLVATEHTYGLFGCQGIEQLLTRDQNLMDLFVFFLVVLNQKYKYPGGTFVK